MREKNDGNTKIEAQNIARGKENKKAKLENFSFCKRNATYQTKHIQTVFSPHVFSTVGATTIPRQQPARQQYCSATNFWLQLVRGFLVRGVFTPRVTRGKRLTRLEPAVRDEYPVPCVPVPCVPVPFLDRVKIASY